MAIIFDGKEFAKEKEDFLKEKVKKLKIKLKMASILVGTDPASILYTKLKQQAARKVGIGFKIYKLKTAAGALEEILELINKLNEDKEVSGVMVQLPLPKSLLRFKSRILNSIAKEKDVDGLTKNSLFMPATVRAVKEILEYATRDLAYFGKRAAVIGAKGTVGKGITEMLEDLGYKVCECDKDTRDLYAKLTNADLVVGATGVPGLIKGEMIKEGCIAN